MERWEGDEDKEDEGMKPKVKRWRHGKRRKRKHLEERKFNPNSHPT